MKSNEQEFIARYTFSKKLLNDLVRSETFSKNFYELTHPKKKKEWILNFTTIRDYIVEYFPDLLWWDGKGKWQKYDKQKFYKHRQGMPNEIRIEFDGDNTDENWANINFTAINLVEKNISFAIFYVEGGRSPHLHIYDLDELENLEYEQRTEYRNKFLTKICPKGSEPDRKLCDEKHLMALEFAQHFKYDKPKALLMSHWAGRNQGIDFDLKMEVTQKDKKKEKKAQPISQKKLSLGDRLRMKPTTLLKETLQFELVFDKYKIDYRGKMALCPFHADKDRSLSFSNEKGIWKCFGCNKSGNIVHLIKFLEEVKNARNTKL